VHKSVRVLSGGERSRLALLKMLLHPANLLILDEPTNHLDLDSKDVLLDALKRFQGTVLFVSHDRFFIDGLADQVLELSCGSSPRLFLGDYAYYLDKKAREAAGQDGAAPPAAGQASRAQASIQQATPLDAKAARELDKKRKAERNRLAKARGRATGAHRRPGGRQGFAHGGYVPPGELFRRNGHTGPATAGDGHRDGAFRPERGMGKRGGGTGKFRAPNHKLTMASRLTHIQNLYSLLCTAG
jgi:energy-coupling factor transporter ATP-binding protein EcfA2